MGFMEKFSLMFAVILILIPVFMLAFSLVMLVVACPISMSDEGISIGWIIRKKFAWSQIKEQTAVNKGKAYLYLYSEPTESFQELIRKAEAIDIWGWYRTGSSRFLRPLGALQRKSIAKQTNIQLGVDDLPVFFAAIPMSDDLTAYINDKLQQHSHFE